MEEGDERSHLKKRTEGGAGSVEYEFEDGCSQGVGIMVRSLPW